MVVIAENKDIKRVKFENPPINELGISLFYVPVAELKAQHIGIYWSKIEERYPLCEQQPPVISDPLNPQPFPDAVPGEVFPLPRFWFSRAEHPTLIQVQRNAFMLNWRRVSGTEYPHYETVIEDFWRELQEYKAFVQEKVGGKLDVIQRCELLYVNIIPTSEVFSGPDQLMKVFPHVTSLYDIQKDDRQLAGLNATVTYRVTPALAIDLAIRLGRRVDTKETVAVLEFKAHGVPGDLSLEGARIWYYAAHDAIYNLFLDSTTEIVQRTIWKPR